MGRFDAVWHELGEWNRALRRRVLMSGRTPKRVVDGFHNLIYDFAKSGGTWENTHWMGVPVLKLPLDLWMYQEILYETRPDLIVETGTYHGGSALFLAHMCALLEHGRVLTVDVKDRPIPHHPLVTYLIGSSVAPEIVAQVRQAAAGLRVMVVLDSDHSAAHVLAELRAYASIVSEGCYLVVEDTNINGHPVFPEFGPGPTEAVRRFLGESDEFEVDHGREKFFVTFNPGGYLKRVKAAPPASQE